MSVSRTRTMESVPIVWHGLHDLAGLSEHERRRLFWALASTQDPTCQALRYAFVQLDQCVDAASLYHRFLEVVTPHRYCESLEKVVPGHPDLRAVVSRAQSYVLGMTGADGGWRYDPIPRT
jgi:hypothetical protein